MFVESNKDFLMKAAGGVGAGILGFIALIKMPLIVLGTGATAGGYAAYESYHGNDPAESFQNLGEQIQTTTRELTERFTSS